MPTIHLEAQVSPDDLLQAAEQIGPGDLERFASRILSLLAHRRAPSLSPDETQLLQAINQGIPTPLRERYTTLVDRRREGTLTAEEHAELQSLSDEVEAIDVRRLELLEKLAQVRGVSLDALMESLGIRAPDYE